MEYCEIIEEPCEFRVNGLCRAQECPEAEDCNDKWRQEVEIFLNRCEKM